MTTSAAGSRPGRGEEPGPGVRRAASRRRLLAALAAILVPSVLLRSYVLSTYAIRSPSMAPALLTGDQLLVLRRGVDPRPLARWDILLLGREIDAEVGQDIDAVAKRLVGLPDEFVEIRSGDVYAGPSRESLALQRKDDALVPGLLVDVQRTRGAEPPWDGAGAQVLADGSRIEAGEEGLWLLYGTPVLDALPDEPGESPVSDTALEVLLGEGDGTLLLRLREGADTFEARLGPAGRGGAALGHNLAGGEVASDPRHPGWHAGQRVLFWNVDNGVRLFVDGERVLSYDYAENADQMPGATLHNGPAVGVAGGALTLRELVVKRDLHYTGQGTFGTRAGNGTTPCRVPAGKLFLLGDNSRKSRDSRYFGPIDQTSLLGRPWALYRPWSRARWMSSAGVPP